MGKFGDFILEHAGDDVSKLLLARHKWPEIDMDIAVSTIEARRKTRKKLPSWHSTPEIIYPSVLCAEQCSSEEAASYNCSVALEAISREKAGDARIADLTGGLGVDSMAFLKSIGVSQVLYNEANPLLAGHAAQNFTLLGANVLSAGEHAKGIFVSNKMVAPGKVGEILGDFRPDLIYIDPGRRGEGGRKVFLLEDCQPDVLTLKDELLHACPLLLLKLSPMADIDMLVRRLGNVREVHCVGVDGECKELLVLVERGWEGDYFLKVREADDTISYPSSSEDNAVPIYLSDQTGLHSYKGMWLYEPGKALSKAGVFKTISQSESIPKIAPSTHLYLCKGLSTSLIQHGKLFRILEILPFSKSAMRHIATSYRISGVTARNLPISSDALARKLMPSNPSAAVSAHIYAFLAHFSDHSDGKFIIIAESEG